MKAFLAWLDHRTGWRGLWREALFEKVPGGARWRYVWGSTLIFALAIQVMTGMVLWTAYSPSAQTAWESVYYIQHQMVGGWFLRGLHHFTAQAMNVLLVLHLMQVVIDGAYRAPREVNFWFGLGLLLLVLGLSLTGYLLPWDQKGYWATKVATNLATVIPVIGPGLQRLIIGGADYGHHTLTRFFALHAGVLPCSIMALVVGHVYLFRRHGLTVREPRRKPDAWFWPDQVLKDAVACLAVLAAVLFLVVRNHGAPLGAPADPAEPFSAARPEWYFLFLFQFLKYFPGQTELWGVVVIPAVVLAVLGAMPFLGRWKLGHRFNLGFLGAVLAGAGLLTYQAVTEDAANPDYRAAVARAERNARRAVELAGAPSGIPPAGAVMLLRQDPMVQGPALFARHCAGCHRYDGHDGTGLKVSDPPSASDLKGFASRPWLRGLLDPGRVDSMHYFGGTKFKEGKMVRFVKRKVGRASPEERVMFEKVIVALSAEAELRRQASVDGSEAAVIGEGKRLLVDEAGCVDCHQFHAPDEEATAPDLTGYGSRAWLEAFIADPGHARFYGENNDRMPAFGRARRLSAGEIGLLADWLREDWFEADRRAGSVTPE